MSQFDDKIRQDSGIPLLYGNVSQVGPSKVFYVNPTIGSDGNPGTKMEKPFSTVAAAYAAATTNNHDLIVLSANAAHAATDELAVTKGRVHFLGLDAVGRYLGQRTRWTMGVTTGTAIAIVQNTGVGNTFQRIKFDSADTTTTSVYAFADGGEYTVVEECEIVKSTDLDQAGMAEVLMNGDSSYFRKCYIGSLVHEKTAANTNVLLTRETITGKVCRDSMFEDCIFGLKSTSATASHVHSTLATDVERFLIFKNCLFVVAKLSSATVGDAIIVDTAQTEGQIILMNSYNVNSTAIGTTGSVGIQYAGAAVATAATAGNAIAVTD